MPNEPLSSRRMRIVRALDNSLEALLLLPAAFFGVYCASAIAGVMVGANPYITGAIGLVVWVLVIVAVIAWRDRSESR